VRYCGITIIQGSEILTLLSYRCEQRRVRISEHFMLCTALHFEWDIARTVFQDRSSSYETLLNQANKTTLYDRRLQDIAILIYKALHNQSPQYINQLFEQPRSQALCSWERLLFELCVSYNLREIDMLTLPRFKVHLTSIIFIISFLRTSEMI
jgi:hypothetical protein